MGAEVQVLEGKNSNTNLNVFQKAVEALGNDKELHIMRGMVTGLEKAAKEGTGEVYYTFDLKVLKQFGTDSEYGQTYNLYNCVMPSTAAMTDEEMLEFKGNEVTIICNTRCSVRKTQSGSRYNSISFYVQHIELSRVVNGAQQVAQAGARRRL